MGLRAGLDGCGKSPPPQGFDPRTVQPVGSRYTNYVTRSTINKYRQGESKKRSRNMNHEIRERAMLMTMNMMVMKRKTWFIELRSCQMYQRHIK